MEELIVVNEVVVFCIVFSILVRFWLLFKLLVHVYLVECRLLLLLYQILGLSEGYCEFLVIFVVFLRQKLKLKVS